MIEARPDSILVFVGGRPPGGNVRMHWRPKAELVSSWRRTAYLQAVDVRNRVGWHDTPKRVRLVVTFVVPDTSHRRDWDNLVTSIKPLLDGLVDAGILRDDSLSAIESFDIRWRCDPGTEGTEFLVTPDESVPALGL